MAAEIEKTDGGNRVNHLNRFPRPIEHYPAERDHTRHQRGESP